MNRWLTLTIIGLVGFLASCGSSVTSSNKPANNDVYSVVVQPQRLTLNSGDWSSILATVDLSHLNSLPAPIAPQPAIQFFSSDPRVTVSPAAEVCAGHWDNLYTKCTATVVPAVDPTTGQPNPNAGQLDLPTGYVVITAYNASHNVSDTMLVSVHARAAKITLSAPGWAPGTNCISQNNQVKYVATPVDANGNPLANVYDNDYSWSVADSNVANVSSYGYVLARNPGVTTVYASLNNTLSDKLTFATCPPAAFKLVSSPYTNNAPILSDQTTADLNLKKGTQAYLTATGVDSSGTPLPVVDLNGNPLTVLPPTFTTTDTLSSSFTSVLPLTSKLTTSTSGIFSLLASCNSIDCNVAVPDFTVPDSTQPGGVRLVTGKQAGFGYPIYSNAIGVTVQGTSGSTVLVTGQTFADGVTLAHRVLAIDSESLAIQHTIAIANTPNSMVVAPNGLKAYLGSSDGLIVLDVGTYQSSILTYPVQGGTTNPPTLVTGAVLGVSPDSRYVLVSDTSDSNPANNVVFLIDTTGTKVAVRYTNLGPIRAVSWASDASYFWIAGDSGVYVYTADTFVPITAYTPGDAGLSTNVKALAWMPDGQSYFASGDQLENYSTCDAQNAQSPAVNLPVSVQGGLSAYVSGGEPHLIGLSGNLWFDYPLTATSQANPTPTEGNICLSTVTIHTPATTASTLPCTATQVNFSPTDSPTEDASGNATLSLLRDFVTGVDPATCSNPDSFIHGYDVSSGTEIKIPTTNPAGASYPVVPLSGGLLKDGRKLYFGTYDSASQTALLHRINFDPTAGPIGEDVVNTTTGTGSNQVTTVTVPATLQIVPSFVAVVPK